MLNFLNRLILICCSIGFITLSVHASAANLKLIESYIVTIPHIKVNLDNGKYDITVKAKWEFKTSPKKSSYLDSNHVINDIKKFLTDYPDNKAYWEAVNYKLASMLIEKYPQMRSLTVEISVPASLFDPYEHSSLINVSR